MIEKIPRKEDIRIRALRTAAVDHSPELTARILKRLKARFYPQSEKAFYQDLARLKQAIFYPAAWLKLRGTELPSDKYEAIILEVLKTIVLNADVSQIRIPGIYLIKCVQEHMAHQGEKYLVQGKEFERVVFDQLQGIRGASDALVSRDKTVDTLAGAHKALVTNSGRKKKVPQGAQGSLF